MPLDDTDRTTPLAALRQTLAGLPKPAELVDAERELRRLREEREKTHAEFAKVLSAPGEPDLKKLAKLQGEIATHDAAINAARRRLAEQRVAFQPFFNSILAQHRRAAARQVLATVGSLVDLIHGENEIAKYAMYNGLDRPGPAVRAPEIQDLVETLNRLAGAPR